MKQRLITAGIGLVLFFIVLFWYGTIVFDLAILVVSSLIIYELLLATHVAENKPLTIVSLIMGITPFMFISSDNYKMREIVMSLTPIFYLAVVAIMFLILLRCHEKLGFEKIALAFFVSTVVPFSMVTFVQFRNGYGIEHGLYYTLLVFACAWGSDSGAYFFGRFFGKRKLSPKISPNKTVEGVYGGVISCIFFVALITAGFYFYNQSIGVQMEIKWLYLLILSVICSLVGVLGDLAASVIKRQTKIKDFGSIMPGHGGALDRFDSVLFVAPLVLVILRIFPL